MEPENITETDLIEGEPTPVCIRCIKPIDPLSYYCPHCGEASGQLTQYLPFVNIRWQASVWGRIWRQMFSHNVSIVGRLFRFIMIIVSVPVMLIGLFFRPKHKANNINNN